MSDTAVLFPAEQHDGSQEGKPQDRIGERALLQPHFDEHFYRSRYPEISATHSYSLEHFCAIGWKEGRDPCEWFSTSGYLTANPDVAAAGINPFIHYLEYGRAERRTIFTAAKATVDRLPPEREAHLARTSGGLADEMELVREYFDIQFYADNYPDMRAEGSNLLEHYCVFGWREGRNPCDWFSSRLYLLYHKEVGSAGINPFAHYLREGKRNGYEIWPANYSGPRHLRIDPGTKLVKEQPLRDLLLYPTQPQTGPKGSYNASNLQIDWVIPDFAIGSGGHMTLFRMIRWLELFGHTCRIWISHLEIHSGIDGVYDDIVKYFQTLGAEIRLADDGLAQATGDIVFATGWQTVARVMNATGFRERCYFVQDYEPSFYPVGSHSLSAEWTYTQDLACICASPWLADTLSQKYGRWTRSFSLAYEPDNYAPLADNTVFPATRDISPEPPHIAVYGRISTPRRCVELVLLALEQLAYKGVSFVVELYGADLDIDAAPFQCVVHGILDSSKLGDLYRRCTLGVCFSATNYSLVPQEMMACGLPVLEIDTPSTTAIFPDGVVSRSEAHPLHIAEEIKQLLADPVRRERQVAAANNWIAGLSWENSARTVERSILERLNCNGHPKSVKSARAVNKRKRPHATVCIPTYNGGHLLLEVVKRILSQRCPWEFDIVIVDSSSSDGSIEALPRTPAITTETIPQRLFQHGRTRNRCIEIARGDFVAFLTQDALPVDEFWLYNLIATLEHFPEAAGAFGRHVAWPEASPFTKRDILNHFDGFMTHPLSISKTTDPERWQNDRSWRQLCHFYSDNNSCLLRRVWVGHPYPEIDYGEDQVWCDSILRAGFGRVYAPGAVVFHSHDYSFDETEKRAATESRFFQEHFGYSTYNFSDSFEQQLARRNDCDEQWARLNSIDKDILSRRLLDNAAQLRGSIKGMSEGSLALVFAQAGGLMTRATNKTG